MFYEFIVDGVSYKLRLTTRNSIAMEKALGFNPLTMLMEIDNNVMPKLSDLLIMLQYMLQAFNHGMNMDKVYDLYDKFIAEGHTMFDLIPIFIEVFKQSGYISNAEDDKAPTEEELKN